MRSRHGNLSRACRPWVRAVRAVPVCLLLLLGAGMAAGASAASGSAPDQPRVLATEISTEITPVVSDQIDDAVTQAATDGYDAYVVELDTPGGLDSAMREIVQSILTSEIPVIVYVAPEGGRATSAGAIITLASHVAVMAPGTAIGAATPVGLEGEAVETKVIEDAAAYAESLADRRGRDAEVAEAMVLEGVSLSVGEAVDQNVVDGQANTLDEALAMADGMTVDIGGQDVTVAVAGAAVDRADFGFFRSVQQILASPNLAFILLTIGVLGLIFELSNPGVGIGGTVGAVSILLALFSLAILPVNVLGVLLLVLSAALFIAELFAPGVAGFAFGGAVTLVLAAVFLFDEAQGVRVDPMLAVPTAVLVGVLAILAGRLVVRSQRGPTRYSGAGAMIGQTVTVDDVDDDSPTTGHTSLEGSWWRLRSSEPPLFTGEEVEVVDVEGLTLVVTPVSQGWSPPGAGAHRKEE